MFTNILCPNESASSAIKVCTVTHYKLLKVVLVEAAQDSKKDAANEAIKENNDNNEIAASFDGTWQKRGYTSLNGVVTVTSFDTGKVLNIEVL